MEYFCEHCKHYREGERSEDPLLPPAIVCEVCGSEVEILPSKAFDPDTFEDDAIGDALEEAPKRGES